jgi:flagellum-specific ATP synthase
MKALAEQIVDLDSVEIYGRVVGVRGLMVEVAGPIHAMSVGSRLSIETGTGPAIPCEVVGFSGGHALAMPFAALDGVRRGCRAVVATAAGTVRPSERWLGRVINAIGRTDRRAGAVAAGSGALSVPQFAAARACPHAGGRAARSRRACAQYLPHGLPRPA